ncbi:MAG TPA: hemolysin III family protein [Gemmataceae bacterium]|nr:hemolysin III family protein [Gemmataceae bacterium]
MNWLSPHDPVSAWTHGLWMLLCIPAGGLLVWRRRRDPLAYIGSAIFAISLVACFGASWLYHSTPPGPFRERLHTLDFLGIYLLIAGSATPIALSILRGWWRRWLLVQIWALAAAGAVLRLTVGMPYWVGTSFYLAMGWIGVVAYFQLAKRVSHRALLWLWAGGFCYSIGAAINLGAWPNPRPGVLGPHEQFHLWVMAGSACHFIFIWTALSLRPAPAALAPSAARTSPAVDAPPDPAHTFLEL